MNNKLKILLTSFLLFLITIFFYKFTAYFIFKKYIRIIISVIVVGIINCFYRKKLIYKKKIKFFIYSCFSLILPFLLLAIFNYFSFDKKFSIIVSCFSSIILIYKINISLIVKNYKLIDDCDLIVKKWKDFTENKVIFKILPNNIFILIMLSISLFYSYKFFSMYNDVTAYSQSTTDAVTSNFMNKSIFIDLNNIEIETKYVDKICFPIATYKRVNNSYLTLELKNDNKSIFRKKVNTKKMRDGKLYCFEIPKIESNEINNYQIVVTSSGANKNNHIELYYDSKTGDYAFSLMKLNNNFYLKVIMILIIFTFYFGVNYLINKKYVDLKKIIFLMLVYIILSLFLNPPYNVPDEIYHFYSSYNLSQNWLNSDIETEIKVPKDIYCVDTSRLFQNRKVQNFNEVVDCIKNVENEKIDSKYVVNGTSVGHLPSALGIKIGDILTNSSLTIFYLSRLFNLIISFLILVLAIKIVPKYKNLFLFVGMLPMFVQQINSSSYDAMLNSISLLFVAYVIKFSLSDDKISIKNIIAFVFMLSTMYLIKVVYIFLALLLLTIPKEKFYHSKKFKSIILIYIGTALIIYLVNNILFVPLAIGGDSIFEKQLLFIKSNPSNLIKIPFNTLKVNLVFYLSSLVGHFSWFFYKFDTYTIFFWYIMFFVIIFSEKTLFTKKVNKILFIISILLCCAFIFGSMYFYCTGYKLLYVEGVQGRYFIPLLIPIALVFIPKENKISISDNTLFSYINTLLFLYLIYIIMYFY